MEKYKSYASLSDSKKNKIFDKNTVFLRENFREIEHEEYGRVLEYDETKMTFEEYVAILDTKNMNLEKEIDLTKQAIDELMLMTMEGGMI